MVSRLKDTLLLVGNANSDRAKLRECLSSGYNLLEAENATQSAMLIRQNGNCIAAVLADIPVTESDEIRALVDACYPGTREEIPVLCFISPSGTGLREELAFSLGATDVVVKPFTQVSIQRRIQVITDVFLHKWHLESMVEKQSLSIRNNNQIMLDALSAIIEHRSSESGNHVLRIRRFTKILLEDVAKFCPEYGLDEETIDLITSAATLHDIGKISIPDSILNKPDRLTPEEAKIMQTHTTIGSQLIQNLSGMGDVKYLRYAYNISLYHHERWDGNGYPCGLKGDEIPICAQVVGIADVFDALTTPRVYKPAYPYKQAINMILNGECGVFSPRLLECFKHVRTQFVNLAGKYADGYSPKSDHISMPLPGPEWKSTPLDTTQLSLMKYQTLLHYVNDTVLELDLDNNLFHMVYNPNPDLDDILPDASTERLVDLFLHANIHPDDMSALEEMYQFLQEDFFRLNLRRRSLFCRLFSPTAQNYQSYEVIFLRINTGNKDQKILMLIWHRLTDDGPTHGGFRSSLHASPALYGLVSSALRCLPDRQLTIDAGTDDLFPLTGFTADEIDQLFGRRLMDMVYEPDRAGLQRQLEQHLEHGGRRDYEFRMIRKNRDPLWVLDKSRIHVDTNGREYIYHALRDNSKSVELVQDLKATISRHQLLIDQSNDIIFEWDLTNDQMTCSPKWMETFGYSPISDAFRANLRKASHFHPDDLILLRSRVSSSLQNPEQNNGPIEVRIANKDGTYIWCRIRASVLTDADGSPTRLLGTITNIDALKRANLALKERAERDALTKLFNKTSTQQLISEYLSERSPDSFGALIILDLDNFKLVNDNYGHMYGDAVLSRVGANLSRLFRAQDVIGRIGGDEFMILLRDIPDRPMAEHRCQLLLDTTKTLFSQMMPDLNVSCSIGTALYPDHGTTFADLFQHADDALYFAKKNGKNQYQFYDPIQQFPSLTGEETHVSSRIDSDSQPNMEDDSFLRFVFQRLYESRDLERSINEILAYIGEQFHISRVYVFENNEENTTCSNTFEWCNDGISPEMDNLQNVSYITDVAGWPDVFNEKGVFYCPDITELEPHFRAILEPQGIKSMLQCAIMDGGVFRGYVGFDECTVNRMWTQEHIDLLSSLSKVLSMFLLKQRIQDRALLQAESLRSILDQQDAWIYVIDPETCELKFLNAKAQQLSPASRPGMPCFKAFLQRDTRCKNCPAANILQDVNQSSVIENYNHQSLKVRARATQIQWNGQRACLLTCHELSEA